MVGNGRSQGTACPVGRLGGVTCGAVGFGVALVALAVSYSAVLGLVSVLPLLSTTGIVFVGVFIWLGTWLGLVVVLGLLRTWRDAPAQGGNRVA